MLAVTDVGRNPHAPEFGDYGLVHVRYGKAKKGSPPKRRSVATVWTWTAESWRSGSPSSGPPGRTRIDGPVADMSGGAAKRIELQQIVWRFAERLVAPWARTPGSDFRRAGKKLRHACPSRPAGLPLFVRFQSGHGRADTTSLGTCVSSDFAERDHAPGTGRDPSRSHGTAETANLVKRRGRLPVAVFVEVIAARGSVPSSPSSCRCCTTTASTCWPARSAAWPPAPPNGCRCPLLAALCGVFFSAPAKDDRHQAPGRPSAKARHRRRGRQPERAAAKTRPTESRDGQQAGAGPGPPGLRALRPRCSTPARPARAGRRGGSVRERTTHTPWTPTGRAPGPGAARLAPGIRAGRRTAVHRLRRQAPRLHLRRPAARKRSTTAAASPAAAVLAEQLAALLDDVPVGSGSPSCRSPRCSRRSRSGLGAGWPRSAGPHVPGDAPHAGGPGSQWSRTRR